MEWANRKNEMRVNGWVIVHTFSRAYIAPDNERGRIYEVWTQGSKRKNPPRWMPARRHMETFRNLADAVNWCKTNELGE